MFVEYQYINNHTSTIIHTYTGTFTDNTKTQNTGQGNPCCLFAITAEITKQHVAKCFNNTHALSSGTHKYIYTYIRTFMTNTSEYTYALYLIHRFFLCFSNFKSNARCYFITQLNNIEEKKQQSVFVKCTV